MSSGVRSLIGETIQVVVFRLESVAPNVIAPCTAGGASFVTRSVSEKRSFAPPSVMSRPASPEPPRPDDKPASHAMKPQLVAETGWSKTAVPPLTSNVAAVAPVVSLASMRRYPPNIDPAVVSVTEVVPDGRRRLIVDERIDDDLRGGGGGETGAHQQRAQDSKNPTVHQRFLPGIAKVPQIEDRATTQRVAATGH